MSHMQEQATTLDLWEALIASLAKTAKRVRVGTVWYVARKNILSDGMVLQVACQTAEGWQGWQVSTIVEAGILLARLWQLVPGNRETIWPGWIPLNCPLAEIAGKITYQSAGLTDAFAAREGSQLEAARFLNLSVPADLSVIGFDGIELSEIIELSIIQQPMPHMGELGAQKLLAQIDGPVDATTHPELIRLRTNLVQRRTISTPPPLSEVTPTQEA